VMCTGALVNLEKVAYSQLVKKSFLFGIRRFISEFTTARNPYFMVKDLVYHPHQTTGKIRYLYSLRHLIYRRPTFSK
jgi:hypothetical protein